MTPYTTVQIDGVNVDPATASIPLSDVGFIRGVGVFEVIRVQAGVCFRLIPHLERLERSAVGFGIALPSQEVLAQWSADAAGEQDGGLVRIFVSAGDDPFDGTARVIVTSEPAPSQPAEISLFPVFAPWHSDGETWELLRGKTLSYGNNFAAIRVARLAGYSDALLTGRSGRVLEGPTFTVGWTVEEDGQVVYETPAMSLGILDSVTRQLALDAAADVGLVFREVECSIDRLDDAVEFFALSTLRDAVPVTKVGDRTFKTGAATNALRNAMLSRMSAELTNERSGG